MKTMVLDVDTPAGRQAEWCLTHLASTDLTAEDVAQHVDPRALAAIMPIGPLTPEGYAALERFVGRSIGSRSVSRVLETRSESPMDVEARYELDDGSIWSLGLRVDDEEPHRIVDLRISIADDAPPADTGPDDPLVHSVDHFVVPLAEPEPALELLTEGLGLPIVLPWGPYTDGTGNCCVELGNVWLELTNFSLAKPQTPARVQAIQFEPPPIDEAVLAQIDRRGIPHTPPIRTGYFTNVICGGFINEPVAFVFFCRWHHPALRDRAARQAALDAVGGGALGLTRVVELVVGTTRWQELVHRWQNLLDPITPVEPGYWQIGDGPAIRIVEGAEDAVREVVLGVRSVEAAAVRVKELGVGTTAPTDDGVLLDLPPLNGLVIRLVGDVGA